MVRPIPWITTLVLAIAIVSVPAGAERLPGLEVRLSPTASGCDQATGDCWVAFDARCLVFDPVEVLEIRCNFDDGSTSCEFLGVAWAGCSMSDERHQTVTSGTCAAFETVVTASVWTGGGANPRRSTVGAAVWLCNG